MRATGHISSVGGVCISGVPAGLWIAILRRPRILSWLLAAIVRHVHVCVSIRGLRVFLLDSAKYVFPGHVGCATAQSCPRRGEKVLAQSARSQRFGTRDAGSGGEQMQTMGEASRGMCSGKRSISPCLLARGGASEGRRSRAGERMCACGRKNSSVISWRAGTASGGRRRRSLSLSG